MALELDLFEVGSLYSNKQIYSTLGVGNAGGIRVKLSDGKSVQRLVVMTSLPDAKTLVENPYHDRIEGDVLVYTGTGRIGNQSSVGPNAKLLRQKSARFPIWGFQLQTSRRDKSNGPKRWKFLGLLQQLRAYTEMQLDATGDMRSACVFEFRIHANSPIVPVAMENHLTAELFRNDERLANPEDADVEIEHKNIQSLPNLNLVLLEEIRRRLLVVDPRSFEISISQLLIGCGLQDVKVTRYNQDGGIDINARAPVSLWPMNNLPIQVQVKRWLHTVGRREVAELRGSMMPYAVGCMVTTSHYSLAAIREAGMHGKSPITLVSGHELAKLYYHHPNTDLPAARTSDSSTQSQACT